MAKLARGNALSDQLKASSAQYANSAPGGTSSGATSPTRENVSQCVTSDYNGRASSGTGSCMLTLSNQCSSPLMCFADLQALHPSGRAQSTRRTFHLRPGASSSEGLTGVIGCQNYSYNCKTDN